MYLICIGFSLLQKSEQEITKNSTFVRHLTPSKEFNCVCKTQFGNLWLPVMRIALFKMVTIVAWFSQKWKTFLMYIFQTNVSSITLIICGIVEKTKQKNNQILRTLCEMEMCLRNTFYVYILYICNIRIWNRSTRSRPASLL